MFKDQLHSQTILEVMYLSVRQTTNLTIKIVIDRQTTISSINVNVTTLTTHKYCIDLCLKISDVTIQLRCYQLYGKPQLLQLLSSNFSEPSRICFEFHGESLPVALKRKLILYDLSSTNFKVIPLPFMIKSGFLLIL